MTILFSEPNVFSVLPDDFPKGMCVYFDVCNSGITCKCEQSKANSIRIENWQLLKDHKQKTNLVHWTKLNLEHLKSGDIFQVEGFEYEVTRYFNDICDELCEHCKYHDLECSKITKVSCILKLAKEEEPKENEYLKIPKLEMSYGDIKELPNCLVKDMYDAAFYWHKDAHPNQKYRGNPGSEDFQAIIRASEIVIKYIEKLKES